MPRSRERCRPQSASIPAGTNATGPTPVSTGAEERSEVMVSAVISTYLLTHLHHVLQRAEFGAQQEGRTGLAANYAQLRQVLCLEARSLEPVAGDPPRAA